MNTFPINAEGVDLIQDFEGCELEAYRCPAGVWTIGYGHTEGVKKGMRITKTEADNLLAQDLEGFVAGVRRLCSAKPNPNQLAAMTSFAFNVGLGAFQKSTVLKQHNAGNTEAAAKAFAMWNKATVNGKKVTLPGLVSRRAREAALYLKAARSRDKTPMPQAVAAEPPVLLTKDMGIKTAATVLGSAGSLAQVNEYAQQASDVGWTIQSLMELGPWVLCAMMALGIGGYFLLRAYWKRKNGLE